MEAGCARGASGTPSTTAWPLDPEPEPEPAFGLRKALVSWVIAK